MWKYLVFDKKWVKALVAFYIVIIVLSMIADDRWTGNETFIALIISSIIAFKMVDREASKKKEDEAKKEDEGKKDE